MTQHWKAEKTAWRMTRDYKEPLALVYDPTPGGRKNEDGTTTHSMRFPALILTDIVSDQADVAEKLAAELNAFPELVKALEFYADPFAWKKLHDPENDVQVPDFYDNTSFGDTATAALASIRTDCGGKK